MVEKGEIKGKGRTCCVARVPNNITYKNNTHILGIFIYFFLKYAAVWPKCTRLDRRHRGNFTLQYRRPFAPYWLRRHLLRIYTYHLSNQGKITREFSQQEFWLRGLFPHRTRLFNILFGWHLASEEWWEPYCLFHAREITHTPSFSIWLHSRFSYRMKILPLVAFIVF